MLPRSITVCLALLFLSCQLLPVSSSVCSGSFLETGNSSSAAVVITGLRTMRTHLVVEGISTSLQLICKQLKECCKPAKAVNSSNHSSHSLLSRFTIGKHTIDIYAAGPHDRSNWFTAVNNSGAVNLHFLNTCAPKGEVQPNWQKCQEQSGWQVTGCDELLSRNSYTTCRLVEVTDSANVILRGLLLPGHHMADLDPRKAASIIAWRHYWMNLKVAEKFDVLKVFVEDIIESSRVILQAVIEFATSLQVDELISKEVLHAIKDCIHEIATDGPHPATRHAKELDSVVGILPKVTLGLDITIPQRQLDAVAHDGIIILTQANCGYLDFAGNWILNMRSINQTNFIVIAEDEITYNYLTVQYGSHHVTKLSCINRASSASLFDSPEFNMLTQSRPGYLMAVLRAGYSVLWMDIDTYTYNFPPQFVPQKYSAASMDDGWSHTRGNAVPDNICSCLILLRPSAYAIQLVQEFARGFDVFRHVRGTDHPQDQQVWTVVGQRFHTAHTGRLYVFPLDSFPNGEAYFKSSAFKEKYPNATPAWVHANWMQGRESKINALKSVGAWHMDTVELPICEQQSQ